MVDSGFDKYDHDTEPQSYAKVSLRIAAPGLDPEFISDILGLQANHTHYTGDYPRNDPKFSPYKHGMWSIKSTLPKEAPFEDHLHNMLDILLPLKEKLHTISESAEVDLFCGVFNYVGFSLSPDILIKLAQLGVTFGVSIY